MSPKMKKPPIETHLYKGLFRGDTFILANVKKKSRKIIHTQVIDYFKMAKHINIKIYGRVQGVFFRQFVKDTARMLGVKGFVRNESDGTVYAEAEGEEESLKKLIEESKTGSTYAKVEHVEVEEDEPKNFEEFVIEY